MKTRAGIAVVLIALVMAACSAGPVAGPSTPNLPVTPPISTATSRPSLWAISPDTGSIYGGSAVSFFGDFDRRASATVDGIQPVQGWSPQDSTKHTLYSPPHTAGRVDLVVTNPDGGRAVGFYTYVDPGAFDLSGEWAGVTVDGSDTTIEFTVRENLLTRVQCSDALNKSVEMALAEPVVNGKVEFAGNAGRFSAWVASATEAAGTIDMSPCSGVRRWQAERTRP
jgi:hypothetical protein